MSVLDLCCCIQAFSSCGEWGLLSSCSTWASHWRGFSCCRAQVAQLCPALCDPMGYTVHGILKARTLSGVPSLFLLHGIFPTQGSNPVLPHYRWILYQLSHPGKPKNTGVGSLSLFQQIFLIQESNQVLLHCWWILYQLSYRGSPCCGVQALNPRASVVVACGLQSTASVVVGLAAHQHVGSSRTRSCTSCPLHCKADS